MISYEQFQANLQNVEINETEWVPGVYACGCDGLETACWWVNHASECCEECTLLSLSNGPAVVL